MQGLAQGMNDTSLPEIIDVVGLITAVALYAMLLATALRERGARRTHGRAAVELAPSLATACLGLVWNLGALTFLGSDQDGLASGAGQALSALAYGALGFLPAVFVDAAVQPWGWPRRGSSAWIRRVGYGMATIAAVLHVLEPLLGGATPSALGLRLLAVGSLGIVPAVLWTAPPEQRLQRAAVSSAAVLAFAVCALHLAQHLPGHDTWSSAFFGHHASLPLILAILYLDYRFAFVDIFLKRALALVLLAALVLGLYVGVLAPLVARRGAPLHTEPALVSVLLGLWIATAFAFPALQRLANRFVDEVVLRRPDYARVRGELAERLAGLDSAEAVLDAVCARLATALHAREVAWRAVDAGPSDSGGGCLVLPTHDPPRYALEVRGLPPGRRLLSDDLVMLDAVALGAARRLDALRLTHERYERDYREQEIARLATEAELRALRAQLNPHFLFNALNTIGYLILHAAPQRAFDTLLDLTRLLRAVLKRSGGDFALLGEEMDLVRAYLAIERARFEDRLRVVIDVPEALQGWHVPALVLQPLVENAIKHGITPRAQGGLISIVARRDDADGALVLSVADSGAGASEGRVAAGRVEGFGLASIERRLAAYYDEGASLEVRSRAPLGTCATLRLPDGPTRAGLPADAARAQAPPERGGAGA